MISFKEVMTKLLSHFFGKKTNIFDKFVGKVGFLVDIIQEATKIKKKARLDRIEIVEPYNLDQQLIKF